MNATPYPRITPWVGRLIIANAVVLLLLLTVFTSPTLVGALEFDPGRALGRPWTFLSYLFVHAGLLHLLTNMLLLFVLGSAVESRMGSRAFILYYLYCGVGAAVLSLGLSGLMPVHPFIGASGSVLGVALAYAMFWPDAELILFPLPIPLRARTFVAILAAFDVFGALYFTNSRVAHLAHVGGMAFGYLFFRAQAASRRGSGAPTRSVERVVMVQSGAAEPVRPTPVTPARQRRRAETDAVAAEVDRVLDKISAEGLGSLTPAERRFLDEVSRKKKQDH
ncbi:MAG TPA: rhomboid family intramembrane serine protease [Gemmatimonadales bacterium]|nr:rhomboid family intramembrane serine protease [Gemmatimonadales bacterium]